MSIHTLTIEATGANLALLFNTSALSKLFGTRRQAVNVNWIKVHPLSFGVAVEYWIKFDSDQRPPDKQDVSVVDFAQNFIIASVNGATGDWQPAPAEKEQLLLRFTTADIQPQMIFPSLKPVFNNMVVGWNADVDFDLVMDISELNAFWDFREEYSDLLEGKTQVEDPSISNVDGKRQLSRHPLTLVED